MTNVAGLVLILLILLVFRGRPVLVNLLTLDSLSWLKCAPGLSDCPFPRCVQFRPARF